MSRSKSKYRILQNRNVRFSTCVAPADYSREALVRKIQTARAAVPALVALQPALEPDTFRQVAREIHGDVRRVLRRGGNTTIAMLTVSDRGVTATVRAYFGKSGLTFDDRRNLLTDLRHELSTARQARQHVRHGSVKRYGHTSLPPLTGGVRTTGGALYLAYQARMTRIVFEAKKPLSRRAHLGVEIEFISPALQEIVAIAMRKHGVAKYVHLGSDASVRGTTARPYAYELRVLCEQTEYARVIKNVCAALKECNAGVNKSCGLHVHLDTRYRDVPQVFANLAHSAPLLFRMVPAGRRSNNFCKRNTEPDIEKHTRNAGGTDRYYAVNSLSLPKHKTIEIRLHAGTVNARKIINWASLLMRIAYGPAIKKPVDALAEIPAVRAFPRRLLTFLEKRIQNFSGDAIDDEHAAA